MAMGDDRRLLRVVLERVVQAKDLLHEAGGVRDRHQDRPVAAFNPLRQRDFFVACQERHPAHVREILPHDIAGRLGPTRSYVGGVTSGASASSLVRARSAGAC